MGRGGYPAAPNRTGESADLLKIKLFQSGALLASRPGMLLQNNRTECQPLCDEIAGAVKTYHDVLRQYQFMAGDHCDPVLMEKLDSQRRAAAQNVTRLIEDRGR